MDKIIRCITSDGAIMASAVDASDIVFTAQRLHNTTPVATAALGRLLCAGSMMGMSLKQNNAKLTLQVNGNGPLGSVVVVADSSGNVKGYVTNPECETEYYNNGKINVSAERMIQDAEAKGTEKKELKQYATIQRKPQDGASGSSAWKEMMDRFKRNDPAIWSMLTQGDLVSYDNGKFVWQPNQPGGSMFLIPLSKTEKKKKICDCLAEITGMTCEFYATEAGKPSNNGPSSEKDYLNQLYDAFGAEKVIIQE